MARKHRVGPDADCSTILPLRLVSRERLSAAESKAQSHERAQWFRDRGIDPGDWGQVHPVLKASWAAHGIESSMDRARRRLQVRDTS